MTWSRANQELLRLRRYPVRLRSSAACGDQRLHGQPRVHPLAQQHVQINPLADAWQSILKPAAVEMQRGSLFASENRIGQMLSADQQRLRQITAGISAAHPLNRLLEAEQQRKELLLEELHPCHGLLEALRNQTSGLAQLAETSSNGLASLDIGRGIAVISTRDTAGEFIRHTDLQGELRIRAVHRLPARPRRPQEADIRKAGFENDENQRLLEKLMPFQRSDQIPCDASEGITAFTNWWKMNRRQMQI